MTLVQFLGYYRQSLFSRIITFEKFSKKKSAREIITMVYLVTIAKRYYITVLKTFVLKITLWLSIFLIRDIHFGEHW